MCFERLKMKEVTIAKQIANFDLRPEVIAKLSDELKCKYPYRLGLSATPVFGNDTEKTAEFGDKNTGIFYRKR